MIVVISGKPASGKGTLCELMVEHYNFVHISSGDLLRAEQKANPELKASMDLGLLVSDTLITDLLKLRLAKEDCRSRGALLDGFPRTLRQAKALAEGGEIFCVSKFIFLDVSDEEVIQRIGGRVMDPVTGKIYHMQNMPPPADIVHRLTRRGDDTSQAIKTRLERFHLSTEPLLDYYKEQMCRIDGSGNDPQAILKRIQMAMAASKL
jgi:adenylate kinase